MPFILIFFLSSIFSFQGLGRNSLKDFESIDLSSKQYSFKLLGDLEGTSMILKVKNKDKQTIAVFKPSSGSTNYRGEYASYKLGKIIGLNIYPKVRIDKIPYSRLLEIKKLLKNIKFKKFYGKRFVKHMKKKEEHRKIMIKNLDLLIKKKKDLYGALKVWVKKLIFSEKLGTLKTFVNTPVFASLISFDLLKNSSLSFSQKTKIFKPTGTYYWSVKLLELSKDFSTMLVLDAVLGNRDRFPGGNVHFSPKNIDLVKYKKQTHKIYFGESKLVSIDNGAVLQEQNEALVLLKKLKIRRFDKQKIKLLRRFFRQKSDKIKIALKLNKEDLSLVLRNASNVFRYIDSLFLKYENKIYFN